MTDLQLQQSGVPGDVRIRMPNRDPGKIRLLGCAPVLVALFLFAMAYAWGGSLMKNFLGELPADGRGIRLPELFTLLFLIPSVVMIVFGCRLFWTGWVILFNRTRTEIRITRRHLIIRERLGGFSKKTKTAVPQEGELHIVNEEGPGRSKTSSAPRMDGWFKEELLGLMYETSYGKSTPISLLYPREVLMDLGSRLTLLLPGVGWGKADVPADEPEAVRPKRQFARIPEEPADTRVEMQILSGGVGFDVPKMGVMKGSHGLFPMGVAFLTFPLIFLVVILKEGDLFGMLFAGAVLSVFFLVGAVMTGFGLSSGTRRTLIGVRNGRLRIESTSLFGTKKQSWSATELKCLRVSPTGTTVNDLPLTALYVESADGNTSAWLKALSEEEQEWITAHLEAQLFPEA